MNILKNIINIALLLVLFHSDALSQIIAPTGIPTRASSQLVYWYDEYDDSTRIQITNTNDTEAVWIHVQIFRSFDIDGSDEANSTDKVVCDERNFVDFLTPNDTHVYNLFDPGDSSDPITKNIGETETDLGESVTIDPDDTKGFVIITPVVSEADLSAISFQHMIGNSQHYDNDNLLNAMGRDAVDFTTGEIVPDGTPLNGTTNGYVVIQPEELIFSFNDENASFDDVQVVGIVFQDIYGDPGLLGYQVLPANANWTTFIFDFKEDPTSCGNRIIGCFDDMGLDDTDFTQSNDLLGEDYLCSAFDPPENAGSPADTYGWTRIFVSGLGDSVNHLGVFAHENWGDGGDWMFVKGERTEIEPPPTEEDCSMEGDEDEDGFADCLDTDCAADESCETGEEECTDEMDNDEDGQADCADLGCDGFAGCEFGEEVSCDDGIDNDADGTVDGDDEDCLVADTGGDGDGGGCVVAGYSTASTSVVNFLILMLPFVGVFGIRRIRKRKN